MISLAPSMVSGLCQLKVYGRVIDVNHQGNRLKKRLRSTSFSENNKKNTVAIVEVYCRAWLMILTDRADLLNAEIGKNVFHSSVLPPRLYYYTYHCLKQTSIRPPAPMNHPEIIKIKRTEHREGSSIGRKVVDSLLVAVELL